MGTHAIEVISDIPGLMRYETACRAVAAALDVDEAKDFRDKSEAMRTYAKQAKNRVLEVQATELRFRAERRIGELMAAQKEAGLMNRGAQGLGTNQHEVRVAEEPAPPTLAEAGIDKNLANRARKLASIPAQEFDEILDDWKERVSDETERVTVELFEAGNKRDAFVAHNSGNFEWYTPVDIIDAARLVLGGFDLDPASSVLANETVRATRFFTAEQDGLSKEWPVGRIWMNPPCGQPLMGQFATKYAEAIKAGSTGIVLVNNATETAWFQELVSVSSAVCFHKARIRFVAQEGQSGAPLQGQAIIYAGDAPMKFEEAFRSFGLVMADFPAQLVEAA